MSQLVRTIGRWTLTGLVLNGIIGSGIFGVPSAVAAKVGVRAPIAWVLAAVTIGVIVACMAEVASRFDGTGGPYLYARVAFGGFVGGLMGWLSYLVRVTSAATNVNLFVLYLTALWPAAAKPAVGGAVIFAFFGGLAWLNVRGVRQGAAASNLFIVAKLVPLLALAGVGVLHVVTRGAAEPTYHVQADLWAWLDAGILLAYAYGGFESALVVSGEMKNPGRDVPFALGAALTGAAIVFLLVQMVVLWTLPDAPSHERPLADAARTLLGPWGAGFVAVGALLSVYGWGTAAMVSGPRVTFAMAEQGDLPPFFGRVDPRFRTPAVSIVTYATLAFLLAVSGSFLKNLSVAAISRMLMYGLCCIALPVLRRREGTDPVVGTAAFRLPAGPYFAGLGVVASLALATRMTSRDAVILLVVLLLAGVNWVWASRARTRQAHPA